MSIRFSGGDRFQRGRGIGGILRLAKSWFKPVIRTMGKAVKSNTGKSNTTDSHFQEAPQTPPKATTKEAFTYKSTSHNQLRQQIHPQTQD